MFILISQNYVTSFPVEYTPLVSRLLYDEKEDFGYFYVGY